MKLRADAAQLANLTKLVDAGQLRVEVSATYPLSQAAKVHELGADGRIRGKVLLTPGA
jgi:NADPH:quinone reductase-like Zn-dependent oxidoreductase